MMVGLLWFSCSWGLGHQDQTASLRFSLSMLEQNVSSKASLQSSMGRTDKFGNSSVRVKVFSYYHFFLLIFSFFLFCQTQALYSGCAGLLWASSVKMVSSWYCLMFFTNHQSCFGIKNDFLHVLEHGSCFLSFEIWTGSLWKLSDVSMKFLLLLSITVGFVLQGVEKLISSKMLLEGSNRRIHAVDRHAAMVSFLSF